jgi:hypothetical protein
MSSNLPPIEIALDDSKVEGILAALRYLSREAEDAGLFELAEVLTEAELNAARARQSQAQARLRIRAG